MDRLGALTVICGRVASGRFLLEKVSDAQEIATVPVFRRQLGLSVAMLLLSCGLCLAAPTAAVSGVVRDNQGVAQMGAMVQVLAANSVSVATAFTDFYGHYCIANLIPGRYQVRATAVLYGPAMRANLQLATGSLATVNLTLSTLAGTAVWLPAERRKADEPGDDWSWTLRSAANRPILRMLDDGQMVLVSSSATEGTGRRSTLAARASMTSGDGGFGGGGQHSVLTVDRAMDDGSNVILRTDVASARTPYGRGPSTELDAGYERPTPFGGASRLVVSYQSHPEMIGAGNYLGMQSMRIDSAQKMHLGDTVDLEAGGTVYAVRTDQYAIASRPFVRLTIHPGEVWAIKYRLATSRDLQGFNGLDTVEAAMPMAAVVAGKLRTESGRHQEVSVSRKMPGFGSGTAGGIVQATLYRDAISRTTVSGSGVMSSADLLPGSSSVLADTVTEAFQLLGPGYTTQGVDLTVSEPLTPSLWAAVSFESGAALTTRDAMISSLPDAIAGLHAQAAQAATFALKGRVVNTGTKLRAAYRWQPRRLVTPVGPYEAFSDQAFLNCAIRQSIRLHGLLPPGTEATVDLTNLLAQGYQPFLSADGRTLFLAQSPRTVQGGLSFTF